MEVTLIETTPSNMMDSQDVKILKQSLRDYANIIVNTSIFNQNNNTQELSNLFYDILEDLYVTQPDEVLNFLNQKPSKQLLNNLFSAFGISDKLNKRYPDILKTKTAYLLSQLFEAKGSNEVFNLFNSIVEEFYHNLNFYNIQIEQRKFISKYETVTIIKKYYLDSNGNIDPLYNLLEIDATQFRDETIGTQVYTTLNTATKEVTYKIKFFESLKFNVRMQLDWTQVFTVPAGESEYSITIKAFDIYPKTERSSDELVYTLQPVLINDQDNILTEINPSDLRTPKYLMSKLDYFNKDIKNLNKSNVFPIITNILYIQFSSVEAIDAMQFLPDLVRMFAMTDMQNEVFTFAINGSVAKMNIQDYMNMLMYLKLKELELKNPGWTWSTKNTWDFSNFTFPYSKRDEIYRLIHYYKNMKHDHQQFTKFKLDYSKLYGSLEQRRTTEIFNISQFREYLYGNMPETFPDFFDRLQEFYPLGVDIIAGKDQNKLLIEHVTYLFDTYKPVTIPDLFNIIITQDKEYLGLNNSLYDMLKTSFSDRFPRIVQKIDALSEPQQFVEVLLENYKRMLVQVVKRDNLCTYFVNDTFQRFLLASTFKQYFFNPIIDLFNQYFFKAEQSYQNSDAVVSIVKDKMNMITCGVDANYQVACEGYFSEISTIDYYPLLFNQDTQDKYSVNDFYAIEHEEVPVSEQIINKDEFTIIINDGVYDNTFSSSNDNTYGTAP